MYYEPGVTDHGLPFDPFKSCVVPRPIGWISTRSADGIDNVAPFSQFTNVTFDPPTVLFSSNQSPDGSRKDTVANVEQTGQFVWNMATWTQREAVNATAEELPPSVDEFSRVGLEKVQATRVNVPMVAGSPVAFECEYMQTVRLPGKGRMGTVDVVFGRVVAVHIDDDAITDGKLDVVKTRPIARMGYFEYTSVESKFDMVIPGDERLLAGLEGSASKNRTLR